MLGCNQEERTRRVLENSKKQCSGSEPDHDHDSGGEEVTVKTRRQQQQHEHEQEVSLTSSHDASLAVVIRSLTISMNYGIRLMMKSVDIVGEEIR